MTISPISGRPDHRLDSAMPACSLAIVSRLLPSLSFGSCKVTSLSVACSDGHRLTLAEPAMVNL
jgi:hypothetical protein